MARPLFVQVVIGLLLWGGLIVFIQPGEMEALLSFSFLVLLPLALLLTETKKRNGQVLPSFKWCVRGQLPFAILATASLVLAPGWGAGVLALSWLGFTLLLGSYGLGRILQRGWRPIEETAIDVAFIYLILGGIWLLLSRYAVPVVPFSPVIVL